MLWRLPSATDDRLKSRNGFFTLQGPPAEQLRHAGLDHLLEDGVIKEDFAGSLLIWKYSVFAVGHEVHLEANDPEGRRKLARYRIRNPFFLEKMEYEVNQASWFTAPNCMPP